MNQVLEVIKKRRSVRAFKKEAIPDEVLLQILEAARWAPSAGNLQPWHFVVVKNNDVKRLLAIAALNQMFIAEAPVVIVVCTIPTVSASRYGVRGEKLYCIQDTAAATQNMLLAAASLGVGSCWVGAFDEDRVRTLLKLPNYVRPVAIVPMGYPAKIPSPPGRRGLKEIVTLIE